MDRYINNRVDEQLDEWAEVWVDEWMDWYRKEGWMRGEMDGGTGRRADRWISGNRQIGRKEKT